MSTSSTIHPPARGPHCPAPAVLEALSAGEHQTDGVTEHVASCTDCGGYVSALKEGQEAFLKARPADQFLRKLDRRAEQHEAARRPWWRFALPFAVPATALVAALLVMVRPGSEVPSDGVLTKGGSFTVAHVRGPDGKAVPVARDERLRPGDTLVFAYDARREGHLLILDLDSTGSASVFHPYGAARSKPIAAGNREFFPESVVLDDVLGAEWLVAVFSPRPLEAAPLLEQLRAQANASEPTVKCDGCEVSTLRIQKVAKP